MSYRPSKLLTQVEEQACGQLWFRDRNPEGVRRLVEANHRFVFKQALKFQGLGLDHEDLVAEGTMGLIEAAKRFDPNRGLRFLSMAATWVRGAMSRAVTAGGHTVRIPERKQRLLRQVKAAEAQLGAESSDSDIAKHLGVNVRDVAAVRDLYLLQTVIADAVVNEGGATLSSTFSAEGPSAEENVEADEQKAILREAVAGLPERERQVLAFRFGLDGEELTLAQCGARLGVSHELVRQIETTALALMAERLQQEQR